MPLAHRARTQRRLGLGVSHRAFCPTKARTSRSISGMWNGCSSSCCGRKAASASPWPATRRIADYLRGVYCPGGARAFDYEFMGERVYGRPMVIESVSYDAAPGERETAAPLGRHLDGYRIGFDLGASDRKCAAVVGRQGGVQRRGSWKPACAGRPAVPFRRHSRFAAARRGAPAARRRDRRQRGGRVRGQRGARRLALPLHSEGRSSTSRIRRLFFELRQAWGGIPFEVVNDGEVTALAGSMALRDNAVLGVAMGSSLAAGFVTPQGTITTWLNELAFVPVDYRENAPVDEWSGDPGVGAQYFSQQAVGRLLAPAGIELPAGMPLPVKLEAGAETRRPRAMRARTRIYETIGVYFGYNIAHLRRLLRCPQSAGAGTRDDRRGRRSDPAARRADVLRRRVSRDCASASISICRTRRRNATGRRSPPPALPAHPFQEDYPCNFIMPTPISSCRMDSTPDAGARTHHAPVHCGASGRYRNHGLPRHRRVLRPPGEMVHRRGGDQRRGQPAHRDLRRTTPTRRCRRSASSNSARRRYVGEYACQVQLGFTSSEGEERRRNGGGRGPAADPARHPSRGRLPAQSRPTSTIPTSV